MRTSIATRRIACIRYIKGHPGNETDFVIKAIQDPKARELVMADFIAIKSSRIGELAAKFDIVPGFTAEA